MFSEEPRCIYRRNQLGEVICQLMFPQILTIETEVPARFQEIIRDECPIYHVKTEMAPPKLSGVAGDLKLEKQQPRKNHQFDSEDGAWRINLTSGFIAFACGSYTRWEEFAARMDKPLAAFIQLYHPAYFERVGLRYLNFISRQALELDGVPFCELIRPQYLGILADEQIAEGATTHSTVDAELAIRGGCRVKLHAGPGLIRRNGRQDNEIKFVFDQDLYMPGKVEVKLTAGALETLHAQAFGIFRDALTDTLHEALLPVDA